MLQYSIEHAIHDAGEAHGGPVEGCAVCGRNLPFEMPEELLTAALDGRLVVFAGAGVSTESSLVDELTFAQRIAEELDRTTMPTFPELMTEYQTRFGRAQLLQRIRERFDYIKSFPELWIRATRFHHALATAYFLDQIVTTNWDTYFEDVAASTPIVVPEDYAFWDLEGRKVFKLHGSMHNLGTLVATESDYKQCYRRLRDGVIGGSLRHLLATKRVVFIGYSFGDSDLNRILGFLRKELADVLPRSYLVTPHGYDGKDFPPERVITTDGTYFIQKVKDEAVERKRMRPDRVLARTLNLAEKVTQAHRTLGTEYANLKETPAVIHALAYQDGLQHALDRIIAMLPSGRYSNPHSTYHVVPTYSLVRKGAIRKRRYWDAAYAEGYLNGMMSLDIDDADETLPLYLVWGSNRDLVRFTDFARELKRAGRLHPGAMKEAVRAVRNLPDGVTVHHNAYLDAVGYAEAGMPRKVSRKATRPK